MNFLPVVDRRTLRSYIDDLYDCAEARQDMLDNFSAIQDQLRAQELRGDHPRTPTAQRSRLRGTDQAIRKTALQQSA